MRAATTRLFSRPADLLLAGAFAGVALTEVWVFSLGNDYSIALRVTASVLTLVASGALALRRTSPVAAFGINAGAVVALIAAGYASDVYQWTNLVATYSIAAHGSRRAAWIALPVALGGVLFYFLRFPSEGDVQLAGFVAAMWVVGWLAGRIYGAQVERDRLRSERDLARQLADANEERLALEEERSRIAHELHDIIGHTVNVMVVHAGAGRRAVDRDRQTVRQAFDTIERTGRTALAELDRVLAVLRRDQAGRELLPTPGIGDLEELARTFTDTGLRVDVEVAGDPGEMPASVGLAAYRIAQEALTNTMKHAGAGSASVRVGIGQGGLDLRVSDDGHGDPDRLHPGRGILGMSERAAVHGGRVSLDRERMPAMDGIEATRQVTGGPHPPKVLILTTFELDEYVFSALQAGASGFLLKRSPPEQLVEAIRTVAAGEALLSPSVTRRLIEAFSSRPSRRDNPRFADMTDREREVLVAIARGLSNEELAEELFISENTVKTHVKRVLAKLGARDRVQAVVMAYEGGLMDR